MPTINDAIVASGSGYSTAGNGGRKLIRLDSGNLYALTIENNYYTIYKSTNGSNWLSLKAIITTTKDAALATDGKNIFVMYTYNSSIIGFDVYNEDGSFIVNGGVIDANQTVLGNISLAINEAKTELHAAWTSKNSTYQSSFNVRYAKGTINSDGMVTWGTVEQVTQLSNSSLDNSNPSIVVVDDKAFILVGATLNTNYGIFLLTNSFTTKDANYNNINPNWGSKAVYFLATYAQSSPSAIFVPQSINGLANGLLTTTWMGKDATSNDDYYIHFSKSMDDGATWSTASKLCLGSYPSITASKNGKVFITYVEDGVTKYIESADNGDSWSTPTRMGTGTHPSSLVDFSINISVPLTIRRTVNEVFFSGSWSAETISPTVGERGKILNRQNILTYNITSESAIGTVTEKINGVVVGTKTLASGQNTTINITQSQWDAIPYGKYRNNSAGRNTIEIVTSNNTFTYTFVKWFDNTVDILSSTKAVKDSKDYYLPSAKKILSDAINSKGGSTTPTDSIESMASQIISNDSRKTNQGTSTPTNIKNFISYSGSAVSCRYISLDISSLGFIPSKVIVNFVNKTTKNFTLWEKDDFYVSGSSYANCSLTGLFMRAPVSGDIIDIPIDTQDTVNWVAYE